MKVKELFKFIGDMEIWLIGLMILGFVLGTAIYFFILKPFFVWLVGDLIQ